MAERRSDPSERLGRGSGVVSLVPVDEQTLAELVAVAVADADPDDVTPRVGEGAGWTACRVSWLLAFHRDRRGGLSGPLREATWAVVGPDGVAGAVRLRHTADPDALETGIWLARRARTRGWGHSAMRAVVDVARDHGAVEVRAETAATNAPAVALLSTMGFRCSPPDVSERIAAVLLLGPM